MRAHVLAHPEIADVPIASLGPAMLRAWVRKVRDDGKIRVTWKKDENGKRVRETTRGGPLAPFTCRNIINSLTAFFADAMAEEWIDVPANPMKHEAVRREIPAAVTLAGKHRIVHFTRPVAEAKITKALALAGDKGWATLRATKTENRVRVIPLHSLAVRALRAWKSIGWAKLVGHRPQPGDPLFPIPRTVDLTKGEKVLAWRPAMASMIRADLLAAWSVASDCAV